MSHSLSNSLSRDFATSQLFTTSRLCVCFSSFMSSFARVLQQLSMVWCGLARPSSS